MEDHNYNNVKEKIRKKMDDSTDTYAMKAIFVLLGKLRIILIYTDIFLPLKSSIYIIQKLGCY